MLIQRDGHRCLINADIAGDDNKKKTLEYLKTLLNNKPGYYIKKPEELPEAYGIRHMHPITFRFLSLINHSNYFITSELIEQSCLDTSVKNKFNNNDQAYLTICYPMDNMLVPIAVQNKNCSKEVS